MQVRSDIAFRGIRATEALEADIRKRLDKLETYCAQITAARVSVELVGRHHRSGNRVRVRVTLIVPGGEVVVRHDTHASGRAAARTRAVERVRKGDEADAGPQRARVAIRETFEAVRRQLQDFVRRQRLDVKTHLPQSPRNRRANASSAGDRKAS